MAPIVPPMLSMALHRLVGGVLHGADLRRDLVGRLRGLTGERFDLVGDDGKAPARFAGARRLDRGVERQKIGLAGDVADQLDDVADLLRRRPTGPAP